MQCVIINWWGPSPDSLIESNLDHDLSPPHQNDEKDFGNFRTEETFLALDCVKHRPKTAIAGTILSPWEKPIWGKKPMWRGKQKITESWSNCAQSLNIPLEFFFWWANKLPLLRPWEAGFLSPSTKNIFSDTTGELISWRKGALEWNLVKEIWCVVRWDHFLHQDFSYFWDFLCLRKR